MSVLTALASIPSERERFKKSTEQFKEGLSGLGQSIGNWNDSRRLRGAMDQMQQEGGMDANQMLEVARKTTSPMEVLKSLGAMDQLQGKDSLDKAGREVIRAYNENNGTLPGNVLADIGKRHGLGAKQLGQVVKLTKDAGALRPKQTLMGKTVPAEEYGTAITAESSLLSTLGDLQPEPVTYSKRLEDGSVRKIKAAPGSQRAKRYEKRGFVQGEYGNLPSQGQDSSSSSQKFRELRSLGYTRNQARQLAYGKLSGEDPSAKEREIQRYLDSDIVNSRDEAIKLAEGVYRLQEGPFGVELWDLSSGQRVRQGDGSQRGDERTQGQKQQSQGQREPFLSVEEARSGVGPVSAIKQTINNVIGPFKPGQVFEDTERAKNKLDVFSQMIKPHLMVSSRGAVYEQQNIEKMLPSSNDFLQDPDSAKTKLQNLYGVINATIRKKQQLLSQGNVTRDQVEQFNEDINNLQTALSYLPDEDMLFSADRPGQGKNTSKLQSQEIMSMSAKELKQLDTETLTPSQREAAEKRVDQLLGEQR